MGLDIGIPIFVAKNTVKAAPIAIEIANAGDWIKTSGTNPLPEKFFTSVLAKKIAAIDPAKVVVVAQVMAFL